MRGVIVGTGKRLTEVVHRIATLLTSGSHKSRDLQESKARLEEAQRVAHVGYWVWNLDDGSRDLVGRNLPHLWADAAGRSHRLSDSTRNDPP